jgi:transposase
LTVDNIDIEATIKKVQELLAQEPNLSPALRSTLDVLLLVVQLLVNRLNLNSRNSSKPPSTDFVKGDKKPKDGNNKPGGQTGRVGTTLSKVNDPDEVKLLEVDRSSLPPAQYRDIGFESRQVFDIDIQRIVTEYRAQILEDENGNRFTAPFPPQVTKAVQYGNGVKVQAVYLSQFQLLPYNRVQDYFKEQIGLPISTGSVFNFNQQAFDLLAEFELKLIAKLIAAPLLHTDETGINIGGKRQWLHCASNERLTLFYAHAKRGTEAMDAKGVLPMFEGILCHDHWTDFCSCKICIPAFLGGQTLLPLQRMPALTLQRPPPA